MYYAKAMRWWLRRKVHVSWLVAWACGGVVAGVVAAQFVPSGWFYSAGWLLSGLALMAMGLWRQRRSAVIVVVVAGGLIGLWRGSISQLTLQPYAKLVGQTVNARGVVSEDTDVGKRDELILRLRDITVSGYPLAGEMWVSVNGKADIKRSDIVTVNGKMQKGFGSFAGSMYQAKLLKAQRPYPGDVARQLRDGFADKVRQVIAEPQASLGIGFLVGQRRALPPELDTALRVAGLMHVVVASGYNLMILVRLARRLFARVSKYLAAFASSALIVGFIAVTGFSPSMSRAGLVAAFSLLAWYYGRRFHPLVLLPFVAAITLVINPSYGWNNLGWQLSFAAFAGVMILAPLAQRYFFGEKPPGTIRQVLGETIAAQIVTLPILIAAFGAFSNVAVVANVLVLPLVPLAMLLTFAAGMTAMVLPAALAQLVSAPAEWLLKYMTTAAESLAKLPWAQTSVTIGSEAVIAAYVVLAAACLYMWRQTKYNLRDTNIVE